MKAMDKKDYIIIKGARDNNLKNISVNIPKNKLVVFTGLSGSGKSTLALNTIYNEGQRRYVESLSAYARQFLGNLAKPDVDSIEGLSPAISIEQKSTSNNPRSTVGTITEIYDYLRLLYARIGMPYCPQHDIPISSSSPEQILNKIFEYPEKTRIQILAPLVKAEKGTHKDTLAKIAKEGFVRIRINGEIKALEEVGNLDKNKRHNIDLVINRVVLKAENKSRIFEGINTALDYGHGYVIILFNNEETLFSTHNACHICGFSVPRLEPRLFSFNAPMGFCPECRGLGLKREVDINILVPDKNVSLAKGAIEYYKNIVGTKNIEWQEFEKLCELYNIPMHVPFKELSDKHKEIALFGSPNEHNFKIITGSGNTMYRRGKIEGVKNKIERLYEETTSEFMRQYYEKFMRDVTCSTCNGKRLNEHALAVYINGKNIHDLTMLQIGELKQFLNETRPKLSVTDRTISQLVLDEIDHRLTFLVKVGLDYLTLARSAATLSGGEAQRIRLATQIGSKLTGVLYVLDEPSIGLHQRDNNKLIQALRDMVDLGNTLIVVEHDEETIRSADHIIDIGPGAGIHGGEVVVTGTVEDVINCKKSITGDYLSGRKVIPLPPRRMPGNGNYLKIYGAAANNLRHIDVSIPLNTLTLVTGVSGSGKSSLVEEVLFKAVDGHLRRVETYPGAYSKIEGLEHIDKVINIDQDPIGRTPRSNPATYTKVFDDIRELFAQTVDARARGYTKSQFSFNTKGGRCEHCEGAGVTRIAMNFLPDVYVKCEMCDGQRYHADTLSIHYRGKNIVDVLNMTVEEALEFFANRPQIVRRLQTLYDIGLGYIKLGQPAPELSGGEAQRLKLAFELQKRPTGKTLYLLDEPSTGLHADDVGRLITSLQAIVANGDTVIVIEHNLDIIKVADYIIDLGPGGGNYGGRVVASGIPEEIVKVKGSYTGEYLAPYLKKEKK